MAPLLRLFLAGLPDLLKACLDDRADLRRMPLGVLGILRPDKRKGHNRSRCVGLFQSPQRGHKHMALSLAVPRITQQTPIRITDTHGTGNPHHIMELGCRRQNDGAKTFLFQYTSGLSHGPAAEGSGRCQQHRFHIFLFHLLGHGDYGRGQKFIAFKLKTVV